LLHISEPSPWLYPVSEFTDQPSETVIVNTVRSKLLDHLPQELPYNLDTAIEYFDVGADGMYKHIIFVISTQQLHEHLGLQLNFVSLLNFVSDHCIS
jgi:GTPase Era involved in 16S rRNA processing